ncbi:MAG: hypothetical protein ACYC6A_22460 [Armatimonadota bacterium]
MTRHKLPLLCSLLLLLASCAFALDPTAYQAAQAAQAFRAKGEAVTPAPDGTIFCEAEEFTVTKLGWQARPWGENYYAATFANSFLSRKAFLGAPEQLKKDAAATLTVDVKQPGKYLVLVRYEACYRFETQFTVKVAQGGKTVLFRKYGARDNVKIWAFRQGLQKEVGWSWGAVENVVWEGHDAYAQLKPGKATITLLAGKQPEPAARRNIDLVMLTTDEAQVKERIQKENYLPLDGWLTQAGDVWARVTNASEQKVTVTSSMGEHSPYWIHIRKWQPFKLEVEPGQTSGWADVGGVMDTLNDAEWNFTADGPCKLEIGVRDAAGQIQPIRSFGLAEQGTLELIGPADMRYRRAVRTRREGIDELVNYLKAIPMQGKTPTQTLVMGYSGIMADLQPIYNLNNPVYQVESLGDEIGLPDVDAKAAEGFTTYLKERGLTPDQVDPAAGSDWAKIAYTPDPKLAETKPGLYYWSLRFRYAYGIRAQKAITDAKLKENPQLLVGANFSPHYPEHHAFIGETYKWVSLFREGGMTMPWAEDYIWQIPVGTPQMNGINLDLFRAGIRGKPEAKILYYVMPHTPGNTPNMWRRMFYNAMGHGTKIFNLFEFDPVWAAYTENHTSDPAMYGMVLKTLREYGSFEDIVQSGRVRPAETGLWFSETGDIWNDNGNSFAAAKRTLYIAILNRQLPLDFIVEPDALDGTLNQYKVLYLAYRHVSQAASKKIAEWVRGGGRLFATAGAGMYDEYNRPNTVLRELMGIEKIELVTPPGIDVVREKEDLPFAKPVQTVTWTIANPTMSLNTAGAKPGQTPFKPLVMPFPVFGSYCKVERNTAGDAISLVGVFSDKSPAIFYHRPGRGRVLYCAFLPGLSYFKPAIPLRPADRGATDDSMANFIPTQFDSNVGALVGSIADTVSSPVSTSEPLVETTIIESKAGTAITFTNWSGKPVKGLKVTVNIPVPKAQVSLATGNTVRVEENTFVFDLDIADTLILR